MTKLIAYSFERKAGQQDPQYGRAFLKSPLWLLSCGNTLGSGQKVSLFRGLILPEAPNEDSIYIGGVDIGGGSRLGPTSFTESLDVACWFANPKSNINWGTEAWPGVARRLHVEGIEPRGIYWRIQAKRWGGLISLEMGNKFSLWLDG